LENEVRRRMPLTWHVAILMRMKSDRATVTSFQIIPRTGVEADQDRAQRRPRRRRIPFPVSANRSTDNPGANLCVGLRPFQKWAKRKRSPRVCDGPYTNAATVRLSTTSRRPPCNGNPVPRNRGLAEQIYLAVEPRFHGVLIGGNDVF